MFPGVTALAVTRLAGALLVGRVVERVDRQPWPLAEQAAAIKPVAFVDSARPVLAALVGPDHKARSPARVGNLGQVPPQGAGGPELRVQSRRRLAALRLEPAAISTGFDRRLELVRVRAARGSE